MSKLDEARKFQNDYNKNFSSHLSDNISQIYDLILSNYKRLSLFLGLNILFVFSWLYYSKPNFIMKRQMLNEPLKISWSDLLLYSFFIGSVICILSSFIIYRSRYNSRLFGCSVCIE